eukprot:UN02115
MIHGLNACHSLASKPAHPVEQVQQSKFQLDTKLRNNMAYHIYGKHFVEGLAYEQNQIAKLHAQGYNSSQISLEISLNTHTTIEPEDFMALPQQQPMMPRQNIQCTNGSTSCTNWSINNNIILNII